MSRRIVQRVATALTMLAVVACTSPPARLYVLNPIATPTLPAARSTRIRTLAILPVAVPNYLDRPEIVVARTADHGLTVSDGERWGEGLPAGLARVLTIDLGTLLAGDGFVVTSGSRQPKVDAELAVTIDAFEQAPDGNAVLAARWMVLDDRRSGSASHFQATYAEFVSAAAPEAGVAAEAVAALNHNVDRLATDIARSVRQLRSDRADPGS